MFPEIVRDEVFRLETRRLWLRWPTPADAFDAALDAALCKVATTATSGLNLPGSACITAWRSANERGQALHLTVEDKRTRSGLGSLHLRIDGHGHGCLDIRPTPARLRPDLAAEAVGIVVHMAFLLRVARRIEALRTADDVEGRAVLEGCGFRPVEAEGRRETGNATSFDPIRYAVDRPAWPERHRPSRIPRSLHCFAPPPACWSMPA